MDFDIAERRLKSEQSKLRSKYRRQRNTTTTNNNTNYNNIANKNRRAAPALSLTAQKQAQEARKKDELRRFEAEKKRKVRESLERYVKSCERQLGISTLQQQQQQQQRTNIPTTKKVGGFTTTTTTHLKINPEKIFLNGTKLTPTSIWGEGDKITLSPNVLALLAEKEEGFGTATTPITFRVGIVNPDYAEFPSSDEMKGKMDELTKKYNKDQPSNSYNQHEEEEESDSDSEDEMEEEEKEGEYTKAYREELSHRYVSYTHATVVEFTQEEGFIGLPSSIASALLDCARGQNNVNTASTDESVRKKEGNNGKYVIPTTRTIDPSASSSSLAKTTTTDSAPMDIDNDKEEKTPGHLAWGAFDIPDTKVEIVMVKLPKGKRCTLIPTSEAVRNGFYGLKDVKLVLEQSLIRTRATLSINDTVHTWHRGVKFDLKVSSVEPSDFSAVSCINTDMEVDIGAPEEEEDENNAAGGVKSESMESGTVGKKEEDESDKKNCFASAGAGRTLMGSSSPSFCSSKPQTPLQKSTKPPPRPRQQQQQQQQLPPEPTASQTTNICTIQIRNERGQNAGRRRFDISTDTLSHLFAYAASALNESETASFRLVCRFPRKVFVLEEGKEGELLGECGAEEGQMMLLVERG